MRHLLRSRVGSLVAMRPSLATGQLPLVAADLGESLDAFLDGVDAFFSSLAAVQWGTLALALLFHFGNIALRSRAWFNNLRAAYHEERIEWRGIRGAYVAGVGVNSVVPVRGGDVVKVYLAKSGIPNSRYATVTSSFFVESIFDIAIGSFVML